MKKILIIRLSSIGDIVLTTPVVRCVKQQIPGAEVHFLTKASFADIMRNNQYVDKVISYNDELSSTFDELKSENYDFVIDLHHNFRSLRVKTVLGKPSSSFNKLNVEKWLLVNLKVNQLPKTHIVDRYIDAVKQLNVVYDGKGLDYFIPEKDEVDISKLPEPWKQGYIAFVIGAKHFTKKMTDEKIIEVINQLKLPIVLIGGKEDINNGNLITESTNLYTYNACGKYNLSQSASLVQQAKLVITNDTGLMHIAAAKSQKIISLWGNTVPDFGMYPFLAYGQGDSVIIENNEISCRPCSKIGFDKCPKGHFKCMNDLDISKIVAVAKAWWGEEQIKA